MEIKIGFDDNSTVVTYPVPELPWDQIQKVYKKNQNYDKSEN